MLKPHFKLSILLHFTSLFARKLSHADFNQIWMNSTTDIHDMYTTGPQRSSSQSERPPWFLWPLIGWLHLRLWPDSANTSLCGWQWSVEALSCALSARLPLWWPGIPHAQETQGDCYTVSLHSTNNCCIVHHCFTASLHCCISARRLWNSGGTPWTDWPCANVIAKQVLGSQH